MPSQDLFSQDGVTNSVKEAREQQTILADTSKSRLGKTQLSAGFSGSHINQNRIVDPTTSTDKTCCKPAPCCPGYKYPAQNCPNHTPACQESNWQNPQSDGTLRKKFQHVLQVLEKLGPRAERTPALQTDRAHPPPRTPQRKNLPVHLQTQSPTKPARRSQPQDPATRQEPLRQVRPSPDGKRHREEHNVRQRDRRNTKDGKDHDEKRAGT